MGAGVFAATMGACAPMTARQRYQRPYSRKPWVAPRIARENIIREVVGHRPFRPGGFVVRSEKLGDKVVVHNYGHGGAGITLSWGSSALAVRETLGMEYRDVAVIGSGVMGLTSARLLQDAGWNVTIYTKDMPRHTTSNVAGGEWGPFSAHDPKVSSDAFKAKLQFAGGSHTTHTPISAGVITASTGWSFTSPPMIPTLARVNLPSCIPTRRCSGPGNTRFPPTTARWK